MHFFPRACYESTSVIYFHSTMHHYTRIIEVSIRALTLLFGRTPRRVDWTITHPLFRVIYARSISYCSGSSLCNHAGTILTMTRRESTFQSHSIGFPLELVWCTRRCATVFVSISWTLSTLPPRPGSAQIFRQRARAMNLLLPY